MRRVQKRTELASDDAQLGSYPRYLDQQCTALHLPDKFSVVKISLVKNEERDRGQHRVGKRWPLPPEAGMKGDRLPRGSVANARQRELNGNEAGLTGPRTNR